MDKNRVEEIKESALSSIATCKESLVKSIVGLCIEMADEGSNRIKLSNPLILHQVYTVRTNSYSRRYVGTDTDTYACNSILFSRDDTAFFMVEYNGGNSHSSIQMSLQCLELIFYELEFIASKKLKK